MMKIPATFNQGLRLERGVVWPTLCKARQRCGNEACWPLSNISPPANTCPFNKGHGLTDARNVQAPSCVSGLELKDPQLDGFARLFYPDSAVH
jgi:hypothetical protein